MNYFRHLFLIILLTLNLAILAQNEGNIWVFGKNAGINFNYFPSQPIDLPTFPYKNWADGSGYSNQFYRGLSVLSDSNGDLMYFAEGSQAWNKHFSFLLGGDSLLGPSAHYALLIPNLKKDRPFLIEAFRSYSNYGKNSGAFYSIVDPQLDAGLGGISSKNLSIGDSLLAIFDGVYWNNSDTVLLAFLKGNSQEIQFFNTSSNGIVPVSVLTTNRFFKLGNVNSFEPTEYGQLKFSVDGKKLAIMTSLNKEILLIDLSKGLDYPKLQTILSTPLAGWGIEFSPSGEFLYYSDGNYVYQIDTRNLIDTSYELASVAVNINIVHKNGNFGMLNLTPDGSILIARANNTQNTLDRIRFPNEIYPYCKLEENCISLGKAFSNHFLPSIFSGFYRNPKVLVSSECLGDSTLFRAAFIPADSLFWDFGDGTQLLSTSIEVQHYYLTDGNFNVKLFYRNDQNQWDTLSQTITIHPKYDLFPIQSKLICQSDSIVLNANIPGGINYKWGTGDTTAQITVHSGGNYYVEASDEYCTNLDTILINQVSCEIILPVLCETDSASFLVPQFDSDSISLRTKVLEVTFNPSSNSFKLFVNSPEFDSVSFTFYKHGDSILKNFIIDYRNKPSPNLPNDTLFCSEVGASVNAMMNGINYYEWFPGNHKNAVLNTTISGTYFLEYGDGTCLWKDSINIHHFPCQSSHQIICNRIESTFHLDSISADSISWNFGNGTQKWTKQPFTSTTYANPGYYTLTIGVHINGASKQFQQSIQVHPTPLVFTKDTVNLCYDDTLKIPGLSLDLFNFLWHDGSAYDYFIPGSDQLVWVNVNDTFCSTRDSLFLQLKDCDCIKHIPNAFSPTNDGLNETFSLIGNCGFNRFTIRIYNRWGEKIFESDDSNFKWDGTYKGKVLSEGVFIWVISGQASDSGELINAKGAVHLLR